MPTNYVHRGEVVGFELSNNDYVQGTPIRYKGFNGVVADHVGMGETLFLRVEGVFAFELKGVKSGDLIYLDHTDLKRLPNACNITHSDGDPLKLWLFGRAVTAADSKGKFHCRLLQSV